MKVLLTTDNIGGVWIYTVSLAKGLLRNGIDVCIAVIGNPLTNGQKKEIENIQHYSLLSKQEWMPEPWDDIERSGIWLMKLKNMIKPDILHLNSFTHGYLNWDLPVVMTAHSCVLSWFESVRQEPAPPEWLNYQQKVAAGLHGADIVVAPSHTMLRAVERFYGRIDNSRVIYNGRENSDFHVLPKEGYIFSMGRIWDEAKNIKLIIEAAPAIACQVYIAGDISNIDIGSYPENVHFLGHLSAPEISDWLSRAAIYLLPVKYEPFGYTFLEAAFSECAIITGDIESMREIWDKSVFFTATGDSELLAKNVNSLMRDRNKRDKIASRARKRALARYTLTKMTSGYIEIYNSLAKQGLKRKVKLQEQ